MSRRELSASAIETDIFSAGDDLFDFIVRHVRRDSVAGGGVLAVTSKIVSLAERACVPKAEISKTELVRREAERIVSVSERYGTFLTIKEGLFIPSAGIDESNVVGQFVLYPKDPYSSARELGLRLREHYDVANFGVILTDSHTQPLRRGVTGIALAHWGFRAVNNFIGQPDLFGQNLKMTCVDVVDALASAAVFVMGESNECCPLAWVKADGIQYTKETDPSEIRIPLEEDLYGSLLHR